MAIKNIVSFASQQSYKTLQMDESRWQEFYKRETGQLLGTVSKEKILEPYTPNFTTIREVGSPFYKVPKHKRYPEKEKHNNEDLTPKCVTNLASYIAEVIRSTMSRSARYIIAIVGWLGTPVDCINFCVSILRIWCNNDITLEFHIYETNQKKYNIGNKYI
jgi:hypothetical protein